jgi:hypothetical protein
LPINKLAVGPRDYHVLPVDTLPGISYNLYARQRDCYRSDLMTEFSDAEEILGGAGSGCAGFTTTLSNLWCSAFPLVKLWPYYTGWFDSESWGQLWAADRPVDILRLPDFEGFFGTNVPASPVSPGKTVFPSFYSTVVQYRNRVVGPDGRVTGDDSDKVSKGGSGYYCPSNELMILNFSPDPFLATAVALAHGDYSTDRLFYHGYEVGRVSNYGENPLYLFKAEFVNNGPVEFADSTDGVLAIVGSSSFSIGVEPPTGLPFSSDWEATSQAQEIELGVGGDMIFKFIADAPGETYCRVQGNLKLYFRKHAQVW